jgi:multidrug efflux pump subunit AcrB
VLFGVSVLTAAFMGSQVLPDLDMNTINMHVNFDEARLFDYDIDKNDLLQSVMYIADDRINERKAANQVADSGISVYSGFKIMGTSVSELGGGIVNTDGMFSGTMFGGAVSGGDLECTILLNDKKKRKASAGDIAAKVAEDILSAKYDKYEDGKFIASYNLSEFTNISYSFNSIAEVASLDSDFVQLNVYSANQKDLENEVKNITAALRNAGIKGLTSVANTVDNPQLEYRLIIDKEALSAKAGGYNATVLLELLRRFKEPSASASVTLDNADGSAYTYNITFYPSARKVEKWYRTNSERYGRLYVEESLVTDENGVDRVEESYFTYDGAGTKYHLTKIEENGREKFVETANAYFTLEKKSDILYFSTDYRNPIDTAYDLLHYELPYENLLTGETGTVPLHEVLKEECIERNDDGEPVNIVQTPAYTKVTKSGGARYMPITIYFNGDTSVNQVKSAINKTLNNFYKSEGLPDGVSYGFSSSTALVDEIFSTLYFILGVGIVLIYLVMVGQFRSLKDPFIILFTILLAFTGSVFSLAVFGMELSIISIMAFIVLAGVVVNNGIVFIDYTNQLTRGGMPIREAILKTASSRLRPILMTAFTTIISLLVMAFDGTQAASILRPMGTAAVGGLLYSTMLTLFIVPILLDIFKKERPGKKKRIRLFAENYEYFNRQEREGK